jgi:hypothetical protein
MAKFCGQCGSFLNDTALFCGGCGTKVPVAAAPPAVAPPFTRQPPATSAQSPAAYTPVASAFTPVGSSINAVTPSDAETVAFAPLAFDPIPPPPSTPPPSAPPADFAPVPGFAPVPAAYTPPASSYTPSTPPPSAPPADFAPVPGFAPVPAAYTPSASNYTPSTPPPSAPPADFAPVPGFAPVPAAYTPPASSYTPSTPPPADFAPVPGYTPTPAAYTPPVSSYTPPAASYSPAPAAYTPATAYPAKKSNTLIKVLIAFVVVLFVGGALAVGGLWYAAQKIRAKVHDVKSQVMRGETPSTSSGLGGLLGNSSTSDDSAGGFKGDPCRFLSKAEVSQAVGLTVIRTEAKDGGCSYIAKGDPADVTSKHLSQMIGGMGADAKTQQMAQKFAGALFSQQEASDKSLAAQAATGEVPVLGLSFTAGNAAMEMKMNRAAFQHIGGGATGANAANSATGDLTGIGDEAYVAGGGMMLVRKGNTVVHFMYISCPCNTDNIKPLARMVASRL